MSEESLSYVLQSDKLKADESEVLNAVKEWGTVNSVSYPQIYYIVAIGLSLEGCDNY